MKQTLNYGKITWAYSDSDSEVSFAPTPLLEFSPVRINGKLKYPTFTDKVSLALLKHKAIEKISYRDAYRRWFADGQWMEQDLGEGRSFLRWLQTNNRCISWMPNDFKLHSFFTSEGAPRHDTSDEMSQGHSFAIKPVEVCGRKIKLYLQDEAVISLINIAYGKEHDFIELVEEYVKLRFQWEEWRAPAPPFLDWVKTQAKRPIFQKGQIGFCLAY